MLSRQSASSLKISDDSTRIESPSLAFTPGDIKQSKSSCLQSAISSIEQKPEADIRVTLDMLLPDTEELIPSSQVPSQRAALEQQFKFCLVSFAVMVLLLWILRYKSLIFGYLIDAFVIIGGLPEPLKCAMLWGTSFAIQVGGVPIASLIAMIIAFCYSSFLASYLVNESACIAANLTMAWLLGRLEVAVDTSHHQGPQNYNQFLASQIENVFNKSPLLASFLVRLLHCPDYVKNYILCQYMIRGLEFLLPLLVVESLNVLLYTLIGLQIKSRTGLTEEVPFSEKSTLEKTIAVIIWMLACIQVVGLIFGLVLTYCKHRQYLAATRFERLAVP